MWTVTQPEKAPSLYCPTRNNITAMKICNVLKPLPSADPLQSAQTCRTCRAPAVWGRSARRGTPHPPRASTDRSSSLAERTETR